MDDKSYHKNKTINRFIRDVQRWGIQDTFKNHIIEENGMITFTYQNGAIVHQITISRDLYQEAVNLIGLRVKITSEQRKSLKVLASFLISKFGYICLMNKLMVLPQEAKQILLSDNDHLITIDSDRDIFIDVVNECQHHKDAMHYHLYGTVTSPFVQS